MTLVERLSTKDYKDERDQLAEEMNQLSEAFIGYREGAHSELMDCAAVFKEQAQRIEELEDANRIEELEQSHIEQAQRIKELEGVLTQAKGFAEWVEILGRTDCEIYKHELKSDADIYLQLIESALNTQDT